MKTLYAFLFLFFICLEGYSKKEPQYYVNIQTSLGDIYIKLHNQTPLHRDNFLKLVKNKALNGTLFHRVIKDFMIQGGDINSKNAPKEALLGSGDLGYKVKAEINPWLYHKKGALAAARDNNPEKSSSSCQFYIVQGKTFTDAELDYMEIYRRQGNKFTAEQRETYKSLGGAPHLDGDYTVFGEVIKGLEVVDKIAVVATDRNNRPLEDIKMELKLLKKRAVRKLVAG